MVGNRRSIKRLLSLRFLLVAESSPCDSVWSQGLPLILTEKTAHPHGSSYPKCLWLMLWLGRFESVRRILCLVGIFDGIGSMLGMTTSSSLSRRRLRVPSKLFPQPSVENITGQVLLLGNCLNTCRILGSTEPLFVLKCREWTPLRCAE